MDASKPPPGERVLVETAGSGHARPEPNCGSKEVARRGRLLRGGPFARLGAESRCWLLPHPRHVHPEFSGKELSHELGHGDVSGLSFCDCCVEKGARDPGPHLDSWPQLRVPCSPSHLCPPLKSYRPIITWPQLSSRADVSTTRTVERGFPIGGTLGKKSPPPLSCQPTPPPASVGIRGHYVTTS